MSNTRFSISYLALLCAVSCQSQPELFEPHSASPDPTSRSFHFDEPGPTPELLSRSGETAEDSIVAITGRSEFAVSDEYSPVILSSTRIAFVSRSNGKTDIWSIDTSTQGQSSPDLVAGSDSNEKAPFVVLDDAIRAVTAGAKKGANGSPMNSARILFASDLLGPFQIFSSKLPRVRGEQIEIESRSSANWPTLSSDGRFLLCSILNEWGGYGIWKREIATGAFSRVTDGQRARWNPVNSKEFVYAKEAKGSWSIWRFTEEPYQTQMLIGGSGSVFDPAYSPDGNWIAYTSNATGSSDIWIADIATRTPPKRVTYHGAADCQPEWSLDGKTVFFASNRANNWDIFAIDVGNLLSEDSPR